MSLLNIIKCMIFHWYTMPYSYYEYKQICLIKEPKLGAICLRCGRGKIYES